MAEGGNFAPQVPDETCRNFPKRSFRRIVNCATICWHTRDAAVR